MIKRLTSKKNLNEAYLQVYRNKGAGGVDEVQVNELKLTLKATGQQLNEQIERDNSFFEKYQDAPLVGLAMKNAYVRNFPCSDK